MICVHGLLKVSFLCGKHVLEISMFLVGNYQKRNERAQCHNCCFSTLECFHSKCLSKFCIGVLHFFSFALFSDRSECTSSRWVMWCFCSTLFLNM